jgi:hypothetical protein
MLVQLNDGMLHVSDDAMKRSELLREAKLGGQIPDVPFSVSWRR